MGFMFFSIVDLGALRSSLVTSGAAFCPSSKSLPFLFLTTLVNLSVLSFCSFPDFHTFSLVSSITARVFPDSTDSSCLVMSFLEAYSSSCLISSQAFSLMPLVFTNANSPFNFWPCKRTLTEPLASSLSKLFSCAFFPLISAMVSYQP
ncbi:hypothetical protein D3C73_1255020 [compost metagenome]